MNTVTKKQINELTADIKNLLACTAIYRDENDFLAVARCLNAINVRTCELQNLYQQYEYQLLAKAGK